MSTKVSFQYGNKWRPWTERLLTQSSLQEWSWPPSLARRDPHKPSGDKKGSRCALTGCGPRRWWLTGSGHLGLSVTRGSSLTSLKADSWQPISQVGCWGRWACFLDRWLQIVGQSSIFTDNLAMVHWYAESCFPLNSPNCKLPRGPSTEEAVVHPFNSTSWQ